MVGSLGSNMAHQQSYNSKPHVELSNLIALLRDISIPRCSSGIPSATVSGAALAASQPSGEVAGTGAAPVNGRPTSEISHQEPSEVATEGSRSGASILDGDFSEAANTEELDSSSYQNGDRTAACVDLIALLKGDIGYIQRSLQKLTEFQRDLGKNTETLADLVMQKSPLVESNLRQLRTALLQLKLQLPSTSYHDFQATAGNANPPVPDKIAGTATPCEESVQQSYRSATSEEKKCLWCFSVFDEHVKKSVLINWWIGQNLLSTSESSTSETAGEAMLQVLEDKMFIQQVIKKQRKVDSWMLVPSFRPFLISEAQDDTDLLGFSRSVLLLKQLNGIEDRKGLVETVKTVFNLHKSSISSSEAQRLAYLKYLTVLHLGMSQITPPGCNIVRINGLDLIMERLYKMKKLRLLSLRGLPSVRALPSLTNLEDLAVLDLSECQALERLPSDLNSLKNLTHLDFSGCPLLLAMPFGIRQLYSLVVLKGFVVGPSENFRVTCRLKDLGRLKKLQKLSICIRVPDFPESKDLEALQSIPGLVKLKILWKPQNSRIPAQKRRRNQVRKETIGGASTQFAKLEKLDLWCAPDDKFLQVPAMYPNLKKLYIRGVKFDPLNTSGIWDKVETLRLLYVPSLQVMNREDELSARLFPRLKYLEYKQPEDTEADDDYVWKKPESQ